MTEGPRASKIFTTPPGPSIAGDTIYLEPRKIRIQILPRAPHTSPRNRTARDGPAWFGTTSKWNNPHLSVEVRRYIVLSRPSKLPNRVTVRVSLRLNL
jgi:hypothetical protein